jgi:hypothetical protein
MLLLSAIPVPALAGGLIQKLPKDGAWVKFYMDFRLDSVALVKNTGSFTIRSVGTESRDETKLRWIEFEESHGKSENGFRAYGLLDKYLVPESELVGEGNPLSKLVQRWHRFDTDKPLKSTGPASRGLKMIHLPSVTKGMKSESRKVVQIKKARTFPYQQGEFECKSATRETYDFTEKFDGITITFRSRVTFTLWKHDAVPFGVAGAIIEFQRYDAKGKKLLMKQTFDLSVSDFGTNAKSALPGRK